MIRRFTPLIAVGAVLVAPRPSGAQVASQAGGRLPDSIAVVGNQRVPRASLLLTAGLVGGREANYRDIQHAIQALYTSGQYDDVRIEQDTTATPPVLVIRVHERPLLLKWTVRGVLRPAWLLYVTSDDGVNRYATVIDNDSQKAISSRSLTLFQSASKGQVFERESPQPNPNPGTVQTAAPLIAQRTT